MTRVVKKRLAWLGAGLLLAWFGAGLLASWCLTSPTRRRRAEVAPPEHWERRDEVEDVRLSTADGEELVGWYLPGAEPVSLLFLHGWHGTRRYHARVIKRLSNDGFTCLTLTLRGHGGSTGNHIDFGWSSRADVVAGVRFLEERRPDARIIVVGTSLGAAAALFAADDLAGSVDAYVFEAPYATVERAAMHRCRKYLPPLVDRVAYAALRVTAPLFLEPPIAALRPIDRVGDVPAETEVVFISGSSDERAPTADVRAMIERSGRACRLEVIEGGGHGSIAFEHADRFAAIVRSVAR